MIEAAGQLFIQRGYPATPIEAVAAAADVPLPTLYRLFGSKRALLKAVLDTSFGGDDEPITFADRPEQQAALCEPDPIQMVNAFARIARQFMDRSSAILHVLATAAQVDREAAELLAEIRRSGTPASPESSPPWRSEMPSTRTWIPARQPTSSTRSCRLTSTGSSPSSAAGQPRTTNPGWNDPSERCYTPRGDRLRPPPRTQRAGPGHHRRRVTRPPGERSQPATAAPLCPAPQRGNSLAEDAE